VPASKKRAPVPEKKFRWTILLLLCVLIAGIASSFFFTLRKAANRSDGSTALSLAPEDERKIYAAYGGSASCKECHAEAYEAWARSHHGLAERLPDAEIDASAFVPPVTLQHGTQQTSTRQSGEHYEIVTAGLQATQEVFQVDRIIGNTPLRQMLVAFPGGRWQATEAAYDPRSNDWFNVYGAEDRRPGEWGHWTGRGMNWNSTCATCHNTRLRKNYDLTNDVYRTTMVERGVGCESCHGPMKAHNDWQSANKDSGTGVSPVRFKIAQSLETHRRDARATTDPTLKKLSRDQMFDTCAACHSRRGEITGDPKPGDSFFDHHLLSIVDESDLFYADGQVRDEDYEVPAFLGSKMFHKGVRCVDCHDFHSAKVRVPGNMICLTCHSPGQTNAPAINPVTHSRHKVFGFDTDGVMTNFNLAIYQPNAIKETGGECVNCHMPQTVYMQRHSRHDHGFTIPDPLLTKQFGIPNACNRCHQDKDRDWALKYVEDWYGEKMNRPSRQRAQTIARARNGDDTARDALLKMLQTDAQDYWRAVAANLLERWAGETSVAATLAGKLSDTNALVRQNIIQTLAALGEGSSSEIRAAISKRLDDPSRNVRIVAAHALMPALNLRSLAGSEFLQMLHHNADQPPGQMQLGVLALARDDPTNAQRHFQTAVRWDSYSPGIRHELAIVLSQLGRPGEALKELQEAVLLAPRDAEFRFKLALAWNEVGESAKALSELEEAVKLDPRHARAGYNLGLARNAAGNPTGAIQALLTAESADPRDPRIPYARATIHARLGHLNEARQAARRALELNPQFPEALTLRRQLQ